MNPAQIDKLVSTVIPVYNRPRLVVDAIKSVLDQSYRPIEIIVVDDGSTDATSDVVAALARDHPEVRNLRLDNGGVGVAREAGRQIATGQFVQYLDSDDLLMPLKFELQVEALQRSQDAGIAYGKTHHSGVGDELEPVPFKRTGERFEFLYPAILQSRWWSTSTPLYRRDVVDAIGPWTDLCNEEDWEYETRAAVLATRLVYCDHFVSVTRWHEKRLYHGGNSDPQKLRQRAMAQQKIFDHFESADMIEDIPEWDHYLRSIFLLARQCGQAGLADESRQLCELAHRGASRLGYRYSTMQVYRLGAAVLGWPGMGRLAHAVDVLRERVTGNA